MRRLSPSGFSSWTPDRRRARSDRSDAPWLRVLGAAAGVFAIGRALLWMIHGDFWTGLLAMILGTVFAVVIAARK